MATIVALPAQRLLSNSYRYHYDVDVDVDITHCSNQPLSPNRFQFFVHLAYSESERDYSNNVTLTLTTPEIFNSDFRKVRDVLMKMGFHEVWDLDKVIDALECKVWEEIHDVARNSYSYPQDGVLFLQANLNVVRRAANEYNERFDDEDEDDEDYVDEIDEEEYVDELDNYEDQFDVDKKIELAVQGLEKVTQGVLLKDKNCAICLDELDCDYYSMEHGYVVKEPNCKHDFHEGCIKKWFMKKTLVCPLCRANCLPLGENVNMMY